jgi:PHD/YefM family antitoxin component YafN of YafNO toxin-antitoxin module
MLKIQEEYVVKARENRKAVLVTLSEWQQILEALEELDDIRAYDKAKSKVSAPVPFEQAVEEIHKGRSN